MKIPINTAQCDACGKKNRIWINLSDSKFDDSCVCGKPISVYLSSDITVGNRTLLRSYHELKVNQDYSLSIVFSATAVDCDLRRLHHKWQSIDPIDKYLDVSSEDLDDIFRGYGSVVKKIQKTARLMYPEGLEKYLEYNEEIRSLINNFPSLNPISFAKDIQKKLFWPRNSILHAGEDNYTEQDAIKAYNISTFTLLILKALDDERRTV
jgi:hypothetical protein